MGDVLRTGYCNAAPAGMPCAYPYYTQLSVLLGGVFCYMCLPSTGRGLMTTDSMLTSESRRRAPATEWGNCTTCRAWCLMAKATTLPPHLESSPPTITLRDKTAANEVSGIRPQPPNTSFASGPCKCLWINSGWYGLAGSLPIDPCHVRFLAKSWFLVNKPAESLQRALCITAKLSFASSLDTSLHSSFVFPSSHSLIRHTLASSTRRLDASESPRRLHGLNR